MSDNKRRQFLFTIGAGAAAIPLSAVIGSLPSYAADMVDPESAQAKALQYAAMSENADQNCGNCSLFQGEDGAESGGCPLFPGQDVGAAAWCSAYVPKA